MERGRRGTGSWLEFELAIDKSAKSSADKQRPRPTLPVHAARKCPRYRRRPGGGAAAPLRGAGLDPGPSN